MDLLQTLTQRGVKFRRSVSDPNEIQICCPFCAENGETHDTRYRLGINIANKAGQCFNCRFRSRYALPILLRRLHLDPNLFQHHAENLTPKAATVVHLPQDFTLLNPKSTDSLDQTAYQYLRNRGITPAQIRNKHIGVSFTGDFGYRVILPIYVEHKLKAYVARDFTGLQKPKYLNSGGDKFLFNFNPTKKVCVLSEGVFKAMRLEQATPHWGSAAVLGHSLTPNQLTQLRNSACRHIVLYPDPDPVGRRGAIDMAEHIWDSDWKPKISVVWPVSLPADEVPLRSLRRSLTRRLSWGPEAFLRLQEKLL